MNDARVTSGRGNLELLESHDPCHRSSNQEGRTPPSQKRSATAVFHITHAANVPSIVRHGLFARNLMTTRPFVDISDPEIQRVRADLRPCNDWRTLHDYASCYLNPRNRMLQKLWRAKREIAIIEFHSACFQVPGAIIADRHAASTAAQFGAAASMLPRLRFDAVFRRSWNTLSEKERVSAELLVPGRIDASHLTTIHMHSESVGAMARLSPLNVTISNHYYWE